MSRPGCASSAAHRLWRATRLAGLALLLVATALVASAGSADAYPPPDGLESVRPLVATTEPARETADCARTEHSAHDRIHSAASHPRVDWAPAPAKTAVIELPIVQSVAKTADLPVAPRHAFVTPSRGPPTPSR